MPPCALRVSSCGGGAFSLRCKARPRRPEKGEDGEKGKKKRSALYIGIACKYASFPPKLCANRLFESEYNFPPTGCHRAFRRGPSGPSGTSGAQHGLHAKTSEQVGGGIGCPAGIARGAKPAKVNRSRMDWCCGRKDFLTFGKVPRQYCVHVINVLPHLRAPPAGRCWRPLGKATGGSRMRICKQPGTPPFQDAPR